MTAPRVEDTESERADRADIRRLIEDWVIWRDSGDSERHATLWRPRSIMVTTWSTASGPDFVRLSRAAFDRGMKSLHRLGGCSIDLNGHRAIAQTRMEIFNRAVIDGVEVDVRCHGRFWDAVEKAEGRWGIVLRQPIYETDRMTVVDPSATLKLDTELLGRFPEGYRNLAYLQSKGGITVNPHLPGTKGPEMDELRERSAAWLAGGDTEDLLRPYG